MLLFSDDMFQQFFFDHVEKGRVAVRIVVGPRDEWCTRLGGGQQIGLLLPIPDGLRADLLRAQRSEAGCLAAHRPASYSARWEVDIRTLTDAKAAPQEAK